MPGKKLGALFGSVLLLSAIEAHATLMDHGSFTHDTASGLDWLDTTLTQGQSYDAVLGGYGGYIGNGWRYATRAEVLGLFDRYVYPAALATSYGSPAGVVSLDTFFLLSEQHYELALDVVNLLGVNISFNDPSGVKQINGPQYPVQRSLEGIYDDDTLPGRAGIGELIARESDAGAPDGGESFRWALLDGFQIETAVYDGFGSFLVRSVPTPSSLLSALGGLLCLCVSRMCRARN